MLILALPETSPAKAHVPVAKVLVYKFFNSAACLRRFVIVHERRYPLHKRMQSRKHPAVNLWPLFQRNIFFAEDKSVYIGIQRKELVSIVQRPEELALHFTNALQVKLHVVPGRGIGDEVPARGICSKICNSLK